MFKKMKLSFNKELTILILFFSVSCVPVQHLSYFNDISDLEEPGVNPRTQKLIMPFDKLYIKVYSIDPQTKAIFNDLEEMRYSGGGSSSVVGYLVDEKGNINFPFVGNILPG